MMPDEHHPLNAKSGDYHLDILCATISIVRQKLSPPVRLRDAAKHWTDLPVAEILDLIGSHFTGHRRSYRSGSGDGLFWMVEAAIRQAVEKKRLALQPGERLPRPRRRAMKIRTASGVAALLVDDRRADRLFEDRDKGPTVERTSSSVGCERLASQSARTMRPTRDGSSRDLVWPVARAVGRDDRLRHGVRCALVSRQAHSVA